MLFGNINNLIINDINIDYLLLILCFFRFNLEGFNPNLTQFWHKIRKNYANKKKVENNLIIKRGKFLAPRSRTMEKILQ
jgi:hypothetical protein